MKANTNNMMSTRVCGIPCFAAVVSFDVQKPFDGSANHCDSDIDYRGYGDMEFAIYDRKGYSAKWVENKMKDSDWDKIDSEYQLFMEDAAETEIDEDYQADQEEQECYY